MKNKLIIVILLIVLLIPNVVFADNAINTQWVYDETNSISEDTINYINELNENELKEYQYAVYITDTLNGENMDNFKTNIFNEYRLGNKENNSGILFVLAIVDREYGLEFGDGISGQLERKLRQDFVPEVALSEQKSSDWDNVVYKVSNHVLDLVIDSANVGSVVGTSILPTDTTSSFVDQFLLFMLLIMVSMLLMAITFNTLFSEDKVFFRGEEFNNYIHKYSLNKQEVEDEIRACRSMYSLSEEGLYTHLLNTMVAMYKKHSLDIDFHGLKKVFSFSHFKSQGNITVAKLSKELYDRHREQIRKEKEVRDRNNGWIDEIVESSHKEYSDEIVNKIRSKLSSKSCDKNTFTGNFNTQYRIAEINDKVKELFPELNSKELKDILSNISKTQEYSDYIYGITNKFTPSHERIENSSYYARENIGDISDKSSKDIWFWLWIYGINSNRISRDKQAKEAARISQARRNSTSHSQNHSSKSYGSSFGGGYSSGGGFSGKF